MKFKISPGMTIFMLGFSGLVYTLAEKSGQIGSKIPLAVFFLFIVCVGITLEVMPKEYVDDVFGEVDGQRGFG